MCKKIALGIFLCFAGIFQVQSQGCKISLGGQIIDKTTGTPIAGAKIKVSNHAPVISDQSGNFSIKDLCAGTFDLHVQHISYQSQQKKIHIDRDKLLLIELAVEHIHIEDVKIAGFKSSTLTSSSHHVQAQDLTESKGKVLADVLANISGVTTLQTGSNIVKPVINGLHGNRILLLNNGVRQEAQQWGTEHAPEIDPFMSDKIEVIKGAQGVRYGADALAGVVRTSPSFIDEHKKLAGRFNVIGNSNGRGLIAHGRLEGRVDKFRWRVSGSRKVNGNTETAEYILGNTGAKELNYDGYLEYLLPRGKVSIYASHFGTDMGIFSGAHVGTIEDIYARIEHGRPFEKYHFTYEIASPRQHVTHDLAKLNWVHQLKDGSELETQYSFQRNHRQEFDLRRIESDDTPMADMILTSQILDLTYTRHKSTVGISGSTQVNNNTPGTGTTPIIPNFDNLTLGVFGIQQFHLNTYHLEVGVRYDYRYMDVAGYRFDYNNSNANGSINQYLLEDSKSFHNASGTVGLLYHFLPNLNWKSNLGLAWRAPSANELYSDGVHHGSGTYEIGNLNLESEKGLKWVNSILFNDKKSNIEVGLDLFGQYINNFIYANPSPDSVRQTIRGTFPIFAYTQTDAILYGADLTFNYKVNSWLDYGINASVVKAFDSNDNRYLPYIPADRLKHSLQYNLGDSKLLSASYLKFDHQYVARQSRYEENSDYVAPPPAYNLFHFTAATQLHLNSNTIGIVFTIENLTNNLYKDYMDKFRYYAHQLGRNYAIKLNYNF